MKVKPPRELLYLHVWARCLYLLSVCVCVLVSLKMNDLKDTSGYFSWGVCGGRGGGGGICWQVKQKCLTSSSSRTHFLRYGTWALPSTTCCCGLFTAFSSSATCPPRSRLASGGCGKELAVLIFPVNLWYSEAMIQVQSDIPKKTT